MTYSETFGSCRDRSGESEYLALSFSPLSAPLRSRWRNNGLSADFLGDYAITFLPRAGDVTTAGTWQNTVRHAVTFVANELLENAMKYHDRHIDIPIEVHLTLTGAQITVSVSNGIGADQADVYKSFVGQLLEKLRENDPGDLIVSQQEESAVDSESEVSGLGLLVMIGDYGAKLGWRFDKDQVRPEIVTVTTTAILNFNDVAGVAA